MNYNVFTLLEPGPTKIVEAEKKYPRLFRILEPIGMWLDHFIENKLGIVLDRFETYVKPQEDYLLVSKKYPIFVVADGVTLQPKEGDSYPAPSGAGEVARIFCEEVMEEAEKRFENFSEKDMIEVFRKANQAVGEYNKSQARTRETINFWDFDLFSTTGACAVLKDNLVYWASICDSYVAHFDQNGKSLFKSPACWPEERYHFLPSEWKQIPESEKERVILRGKTVHRIYRNGLGEKGEIIGYGVANGESAAEKYLNFGALNPSSGDLVALFSDGFEEYMRSTEFIDLFKVWPDNLEKQVKEFTHRKSKSDPASFGHERSLILIRPTA